MKFYLIIFLAFLSSMCLVCADAQVRIEYYNNISNAEIFLNETIIFNFSGNFTGTNTTSDFSTTLNTALNNGNCDCSGCELSGDNCTINMTVHSDTSGLLTIDSLNITYTDERDPNITINEPNRTYNSTEIPYNISLSESDPSICKYWVTRGASLEVANTTITCSEQMTGNLYVSSVGTDYKFYFYAEDTSGNNVTETTNFSTSSTATIITAPSGGGGGSIETPSEEDEDIDYCSFYVEPLNEAWNNFINNTNSENFSENFIRLWNAFWSRALCDSASSIIPIR